MPRIHKDKDLTDSIKVSFRIFYEESGYKKSLPLEFYKMRKRLIKFWYFTFPSVTKEGESIGPFWTKKGAVKYAKNLLINGEFIKIDQ